MKTSNSTPVRLSAVLPGQRYMSLSGQVFLVLTVNVSAKSLTVLALSGSSGAGSANAMKEGERRLLVNGHQWCAKMQPYDGPLQGHT